MEYCGNACFFESDLKGLGMNLRSIVPTTAFAMIVLCNSFAEAQSRPRRSSRPLFPSHERVKTEADQAYQRGDYAKAIELTSSVLRLNRQDHVGYYLRASARVDLGQARGDANLVRQGISDAREAIRLTTSRDVNYFLPYIHGMTSLAAIEARNSHAEVAVNVAGGALKRASLTSEQRANLLYQRAMAQMHLKLFEPSVRDLTEAIRISPTHVGAHVGLADAYAASGKNRQALQSFDAAIKAFPSNPLIYNNRGMFLQQQGKAEEAIGDFTMCIELDGDFYVAYMNRGFALMEMDDPESAENDFTSAMRINSSQPMVRSMRAASRLAQGRLQSAIEDYSAVVAQDQRNAMAHADLGFARFFAKEFVGAKSSFDKAMSFDAEFRFLEPWCCWSMIRAGDADAATSRFKKTLDKEAKNREWTDHLVAYLLDGATEESLMAAIHQEDQAVKIAQTCEAHFFIGQRMAKESEHEQANDHFRRALKTNAKHLSAYRGARNSLKLFSTDC